MRRHGIERVRHRMRRTADSHGDALRMSAAIARQAVRPPAEMWPRTAWSGAALGTALMMRFTSGRKPMSNMRSASSSTRISMCSSRARSLGHEIEQAARAGDQDLRAVAQRLDLRAGSDAAVDGCAAQPGPRRQRAYHLMDLLGQFARRRDDQRAWHAAWTLQAACSEWAARMRRSLPVPVCAVPMRSRPRSAAGIAAS